VIAVTATGIDHVQANLKGAAAGFDRASYNTIVKGSITLHAMLDRQLDGPKGWDDFWGATSPKGPFLGSRTGQTRFHLTHGGFAYRTAGGWQAAIGSPDAHVVLHELGGRRGKSIIPTAAAQRKDSGTFRWPGIQSWSEIPGIFNFPSQAMRNSSNPAVAAKYRNMKPWLARVEDGKVRLLGLIVPSVTYRARGMFAAVHEKIEPVIIQMGQFEAALVVKAANA
jgi:hypothetical protein